MTLDGASKAVAERPREVNSNKGRFGHVLVVGGAMGRRVRRRWRRWRR